LGGIGYWVKNLIIDELCLIGQFPYSLRIDIAALLTGTSRPREPEETDGDEPQKYLGSAFVKLAGTARKAQNEGSPENNEEKSIDENKDESHHPGEDDIVDEEEEDDEEEGQSVLAPPKKDVK